MKKFCAWLLVAGLTAATVACGGTSSGGGTSTAAEQTSQATEQTSQAAEQTSGGVADAAIAESVEGEAGGTEVTICGTNGPGDTQSIAHQNLASYLNALGGWNAVAMVSSEMGSTDDVLEQGMSGAAVLAATDPARIAAYVPGIGILMMPYMFDSYDQLDVLMETDLYKQWCDELREEGLVLLTNNCITGFRQYVTNSAVQTPADLNGLKIRTMGSAIALNSVNAMGAIATPMAQSEA